MTRHSVAIIGGRIGAEHLTGYLALPERFRVACICDIDQTVTNRLAARTSEARTTDDLASVMGDPDIDIVDICLPPRLHVPVSLEALRAGKHVICEKPVAGCLIDAEQVRDAAAEHDRLWVPVFQYRFGEGFLALQLLKAEGLLGRPLVGSLETHWDRRAEYYVNPWRGTPAGEFAGVVLNHAIHIHDLATTVLGPVAEVSAVLDTRVNSIETEDCAAICMRMEAGGLVTSSVTLGASGNMSRLRLVFERLTATSGQSPYAPGDKGWSFSARHPDDQGKIDRVVADEVGAHRKTGYAGLFEAVADRLDDRASLLPTPDDGVRSIELATAIYQAAITGGQVSMPMDRGLEICSEIPHLPQHRGGVASKAITQPR